MISINPGQCVVPSITQSHRNTTSASITQSHRNTTSASITQSHRNTASAYSLQSPSTSQQPPSTTSIFERRQDSLTSTIEVNVQSDTQSDDHQSDDHQTDDLMIQSYQYSIDHIELELELKSSTDRLQIWDTSNYDDFANIKRDDINIIRQYCRIPDESKCTISLDGSLVAVFVPDETGFYMDRHDIHLQVISLKSENYLQCIYSRKYGHSAICVSFSPTNQYIVVGFAIGRMHWQPTQHQLIGQILKLPSRNDAIPNLMDESRAVLNIIHGGKKLYRSNISTNVIRFHPKPGMGLVYGTNKGHVQHCSITSSNIVEDKRTIK